MPPTGAEARAEQRATLNRIAHELQVSPDLGALLEELRPFEEEHDRRVVRGEPRPGRPARLREGRPRPARAARGADARRLARLPGWLARARAGGLRDHAAAPRAEPRAAPPVRRVLRLRRRPVRRRPRRLRARHEDGRGRGDLRPAQGGAPADDPGGRATPSRSTTRACAAASRARRSGGSRSPCSSGGAWTAPPGGSTRPCIRSRRRSRRPTSASRRTSTRTRCTGSSPACTSSATASTSGRSIRRTRARRSRRACRPRSTSRRAACGRTSSAAASRRGGSSIRGCRTSSPTSSARSRSRRFHRALNKVQPSFRRVDADEVTYCLHIILRFELERGMLSGEVALKDLPEAFNEKMREYLGLQPPGRRRAACSRTSTGRT